MTRLSAFLLTLVLALAAFSQSKLGGTAKLGGTVKSSVTGGGGSPWPETLTFAWGADGEKYANSDYVSYIADSVSYPSLTVWDNTTSVGVNVGSLKVSSGGTPLWPQYVFGSVADGGQEGVFGSPGTAGRFSFWYRHDGAHSTAVYVGALSTTTGGLCAVWLNTSAQIYLVNSASGGTIGSPSSTLTSNTWYRISVAFKINAANDAEYKLWLNGSLIASGTSQYTADRTNATSVTLGFIGGLADTNKNVWYDSLVCDSGSGMNAPGEVYVAGKYITATNDNNWTTTLGTGAVNEYPTDNRNGMRESGATALAQNYTVQGRSTGVDLSAKNVVGYMGWAFTKRGAGTQGDPKLTLNGTDYSVVPTDGAAYKARWKILTTQTYYSSAAGIGMKSSGADADTDLIEAGILVVYTP